MINLFTGFDKQEEIGTHVFHSSVIHRSSSSVSFVPLHLPMLCNYRELHKDGTNAFTYTRFLIPHLMHYSGWALFCDGADMVCVGDIAELWALRDPFKAVQVVKHEYKTRHPRKYVGTLMESANEDYPRKNWSSVMLINCSHYDWRRLDPTTISHMTGAELNRLEFTAERFIGEIPIEWNWLVDEYGTNNHANILHWTAGMPAFEHYKDAPMAQEWRAAHARVNHADQ